MQVTHVRPAQERPTLPGPSYPAQVLTVAARILLLEPGHWAFDAHALNDAVRTASEAILTTLPEPVQRDARSRARAALPAVGDQTRAQYAERLRYTARGL